MGINFNKANWIYKFNTESVLGLDGNYRGLDGLVMAEFLRDLDVGECGCKYDLSSDLFSVGGKVYRVI